MNENDSSQDKSGNDVVYERVPFPRPLLEAGERVMSQLHERRNSDKNSDGNDQ